MHNKEGQCWAIEIKRFVASAIQYKQVTLAEEKTDNSEGHYDTSSAVIWLGPRPQWVLEYHKD